MDKGFPTKRVSEVVRHVKVKFSLHFAFYQPRSKVYGTVDALKYYHSPNPNFKREILMNAKFKICSSNR